MSLFRKPKKTIQRRVFTEKDEEDEDEPMEVQQSSGTEKEFSKKSSKSKAKKQTLLSFETEEEGEVFQVKKSSHSKKLMRMYERDRHKKKEIKTEKEEPKIRGKTEIVTDDLVVVVNSSHQKPATPPPPILSGRDALCAGKDDLSSEEDEQPTLHRFSKPDNFKQVLESGAIPDAAMIHAARKRRQKAREMGGDYIPVEDEPEDNGRLMREDENDGSDEERIDMDVNLLMRDQERRREQFLAAQESDHEIDEWEDQQIRKGVTSASAAAVSQELMYEYQANTVANVPPPPPPPSLDPGVPRTPQAIAEKLREHFDGICASREKNAQKLQKTQEEITAVTKELSECQLKAPVAAEKFKFYQELRGYVTDLVECLDEKVSFTFLFLCVSF